MKDNKFILGIVVGVLVCAVIGLAVLVGVKFVASNDKEESDKNEKTEEVVELKLDDSLVKQASLVRSENLCGEAMYDYDGTTRTIKEINKDTKLNMIVNVYLNDIIATVNDDTEFKLKVTDLNKYFEDVSFIDEYFKDVDSSKDSNWVFGYPFSLKIKDGYLIFKGYPTGCEGLGEGFKDKLIKAEKKADELYLTYIVYNLGFDYDKKTDDFIGYTTKNSKSKDKIETNLKQDDNYGYILNYDLYDKYIYTFDTKDNNLRLKEIKYVKE